MEQGYITLKEQSPIKDCPPAPKKESNYTVINGHTGDNYKPSCLGTFMGALEAYSRGMKLSDEEKNCLQEAGFKINI